MIHLVKNIQNVNLSSSDLGALDTDSVTIVADTSGIKLADLPGYKSVAKFGRNSALSTVEDIVDQGGTIVYPSDGGTACFIAAAVDSAATQGMTTQVFGLDANFAEQTTTPTLDAGDSTNEVAAGTFSRIFRIKNTSATDQDQNIIVGPTGLATTYCQMTSPNNQTLYGAYTIPAGKVAYIKRWGCSILKTGAVPTSREASAYLYVRPFGGTFQLKHVYGIGTAGTSNYEKVWDILAPDGGIAEKSDIKVSAIATAASDISTWFDIEMITA